MDESAGAKTLKIPTNCYAEHDRNLHNKKFALEDNSNVSFEAPNSGNSNKNKDFSIVSGLPRELSEATRGATETTRGPLKRTQPGKAWLGYVEAMRKPSGAASLPVPGPAGQARLGLACVGQLPFCNEMASLAGSLHVEPELIKSL